MLIKRAGKSVSSEKSVLAAYKCLTGKALSVEEQNAANAILLGCETQQDRARKIYNLLDVAKTPEEMLMKAIVSQYCGAAYRPQAIESILSYLQQPERVRENAVGSKGVSAEVQTECFLYTSLGDAFSGEHMLTQAVQAYLDGARIAPMYIHNYIKAAKALVKLGDFCGARKVIESAQKSGMQWDDIETRDFLRCLDDINEKEKSGYTYKPRKKK